MELDVEGAVVRPRRVKLRRVLVYEVGVLGPTGSTKVLHLRRVDKHTHTTISHLEKICHGSVIISGLKQVALVLKRMYSLHRTSKNTHNRFTAILYINLC